ncbi:MAG: response regulator transcription factor [Clostridia bacterium]|nr:response regulator transcription factor [Clostridia bacterium]
MIKVVIADDQAVIRNGIKFIIEQDPDIQVAGCAANGKEAFELCERLHPDVVLMDIVMPVCDGIEATKRIKEKFSTIKIMILTTFNDDENVASALKNGADGFVLKDIETEELLLTVKSIAKGLRVIHEDAFGTVFKQLNSDKTTNEEQKPDLNIQLTEREISIIRLIVFGKNNKEIAGELFLSEGSVRNMISAILSKLKLKDRTQLAVFAVKNNLI